MLFTLFVAVPTGLLGLGAFGYDDRTKPMVCNVLDRMPSSAWRTAAAVSLSVHMVVAFAVLLMPLMEAFESAHAPLHTSWKLRICSRTFWSLLCVLIGVAFPFFGDIVALVASIAQVYLSFVAPPLLYVLVFKETLKQTFWGHLKIGFALLMAGSMLIFGTGFGLYASIIDLEAKVGTWGLFKPFY